MGKAILIIVVGAGLFTARGLLSSQETEKRTRQQQGSYEENVLAREIARSGFNVAMGMMRQYGDSLYHGANAINGTEGYMEGEYQGGTYRVRVEPITGSSVEVVSTGYFGGAFNEDGEYEDGATHEMGDLVGRYDLPTPPLQAKTCGLLEVEFLQSEAGYCSAVYLQRYLLGVPDHEQPEPEMIFAPGNYRTGEGIQDVEKLIQSGTQMNFFIGVSQDCKPYDHHSWNRNDRWKTYDVEDHDFDARDYNHLHYALSGEIDELGRMEESVWGLIEQHPADNQRWRIAWEDQHITSWDRPHSDNPRSSLQATKRYGYDGHGWPSEDAWGYRTLRDFGDRPDFSDQVIEVSLTPTTGCDPLAMNDPDDEEDPDEGGWDDGSDEEDPDEGEGEDGSDEEDPDDELETSPSCECPKHAHQTHKVAIWHQLPNQKKGKINCIAESAVEHHLRNHNDFVVCRGE